MRILVNIFLQVPVGHELGVANRKVALLQVTGTVWVSSLRNAWSGQLDFQNAATGH